MDLETLRAFFFYCMVVTGSVYFLTALAVWAFGDLICKINCRVFGLEEEAVRKATLAYLANFKLAITVFTFAPWLALLIMQ